MTKNQIFRATVAAASLSCGVAANADILTFTGSVTGLSTFVGLDPTCAPLPFRSAIDPSTTVGQSSLGDFTYSTSTCLGTPGSASFGSFIIDFGVDSFNGTFDGGSTPTAIPGISDVAWTFTVLGGTGRFLDASGTFDGVGTADARTRPTQIAISFNGIIDAPAVPEPATWEFLILGFGGIGLAMRRRRLRGIEQLG
jgi:hypothetical protein